MPLNEQGEWHPNLFGKQLDVFNNRSRALLVCGPRKSGKCVSGETIVQTSDGLTRMRRFGPPIKPGEYLLCGSGITSFETSSRTFKPSETSGWYMDQSTDSLQFSVHGGYQVTTSTIHPLWSIVDGVEDYRRASELRSALERGFRVHLPIRVGHPGWSSVAYKELKFLPSDKMKRLRFFRNQKMRSAIQLVGSKRLYEIARLAGTTYHTVQDFIAKPMEVFECSVALDEDLAYLLGAMIGDGCMTPKNMTKNRIGIAGNDLEVMASCRSAIEKHFPGASLVYIKGCDWEIRSSEVRGFVREMSVDCYAHEKVIPDAIIESPKSVVRAFLQALFDTDGTADRGGRVSFCSSSERLSRDVQQLLLAFGMVSSVRRKQTKRRPAFEVSLNGASALFFQDIGFRIARKQSRKSALPHERRTVTNRYPTSPESLTEAEKNAVSMSGEVIWRELKQCVETKSNLYDVTVPRYHSFVGNGFINHNTWVTLHKIVRHLWETPAARVAMFSRTLKNSKEGGTWSDLHTIILPEWFKSRVGIRYTTKSQEGKPGPKVDGQTRTPYFKVRNMYGGESELMLFSLDFDGDIEDKLKEQRFSMIYFSELSKFRDRKILSVALPSLRMPHLPMEQQQWLSDTNPSEEGDASWIYDVWYIERLLSYEIYSARQRERGQTVMAESVFTNFQKGLGLIEIKPEENPFLDPRELEELKSTYAYDEGLYERYVNGKWVYGDGNKSIHFLGKFFPNKHLVGSTEAMDESEWTYANPSPNCFELVTGWDLGEVNHAAVIIERMVVNGRSHFVVLDELESVGEEIDNTTFTEAVMEQVETLEGTVGRALSLDRAWSDNSSFSFRASGGNYPYLEVYAASGNRITLQAVPKPRDSVKARVQLLKQLLVQDRIRISAHCRAIVRMFRKLKKGQTILDYVVRDENKHIFDALTYALFMEMAEELENSPARGTVGSRPPLAISIGR